jgi:hypothetical protein
MPDPCTCHDGLTCVPCYYALLAASARTGFALPPEAFALPPELLARWVPPAESSTHLQARIQEVARLLGGWKRFTVRRSDKAQVAAGWLDDFYLGHGRQVVMEYKNEGEKVTMKQQEWLEAWWMHSPLTEVHVGWPSDEVALVTMLRGPAPMPRDRQWMTRLPMPCGCAAVV